MGFVGAKFVDVQPIKQSERLDLVSWYQLIERFKYYIVCAG